MSIRDIMAKSNSYYCACLVLIALLTGCSKKELVPVDYVKWVEDEQNNLKQTKSFGDYELSVQYKPADYIVALEKKDPGLEKKMLDERKKEIDAYQYYRIRYSVKNTSKDFMKYGISSEQEYYDRMNYLSFGFQDDIRLVEGKDTLPCVLFNCVRNYGLSPQVDFEVGFKKSADNTDRTLLIDDKVMGIGTMKFSFAGSDIENTPIIRTY